MGIDLVIFDCDGVLVDSEAITASVWVESVREAGLDWQVADVLHHFRGGKAADVIARAELELGGPLPADHTERFRARLFERLRTEVQAVPGIHDALDAIPYPVCVASNGPVKKMEATLGSTGLLERFAGRIFSGYDVDSFKPEPGLFLHAAKELGAQPARCVVVEDSGNGVRAAVAAGMRVMLYLGHDDAKPVEGAIPFDDMRELPALLSGLDD